MSYALPTTHPGTPAGMRPWQAWLMLGLMAVAGASLAQPANTLSAPLSFHIQAQPLADALAAYSHISGMTVLVDSALTDGRMAPAVEGSYTADDALRRLVADAPLAIRYAGARAFTLVRSTAPVSAAGTSLRGTSFGARLQDVLRNALCRNTDTAPGAYRALIQLRFSAGARIERVDWITSSGKPDVDRRVQAALLGASAAPLPPGLPQPVTVLLQPRPQADCPPPLDAARVD